MQADSKLQLKHLLLSIKTLSSALTSSPDILLDYQPVGSIIADCLEKACADEARAAIQERDKLAKECKQALTVVKNSAVKEAQLESEVCLLSERLLQQESCFVSAQVENSLLSIQIDVLQQLLDEATVKIGLKKDSMELSSHTLQEQIDDLQQSLNEAASRLTSPKKCEQMSDRSLEKQKSLILLTVTISKPDHSLGLKLGNLFEDAETENNKLGVKLIADDAREDVQRSFCVNDEIIMLNGMPVQSAADFGEIYKTIPAGCELIFTIQRHDVSLPEELLEYVPFLENLDASLQAEESTQENFAESVCPETIHFRESMEWDSESDDGLAEEEAENKITILQQMLTANASANEEENELMTNTAEYESLFQARLEEKEFLHKAEKADWAQKETALLQRLANVDVAQIEAEASLQCALAEKDRAHAAEKAGWYTREALLLERVAKAEAASRAVAEILSQAPPVCERQIAEHSRLFQEKREQIIELLKQEHSDNNTSQTAGEIHGKENSLLKENNILRSKCTALEIEIKASTQKIEDLLHRLEEKENLTKSFDVNLEEYKTYKQDLFASKNLLARKLGYMDLSKFDIEDPNQIGHPFLDSVVFEEQPQFIIPRTSPQKGFTERFQDTACSAPSLFQCLSEYLESQPLPEKKENKDTQTCIDLEISFKAENSNSIETQTEDPQELGMLTPTLNRDNMQKRLVTLYRLKTSKLISADQCSELSQMIQQDHEDIRNLMEGKQHKDQKLASLLKALLQYV